ncbi:hypothetical protein [Spirillospora sp. NPDC047279]|uniref:hypothetical protein n=1 Tax=Spirillospora sp. NPDC047279 TaxID=3155478 RepID=UPI0033DEA15B
MSAVVGSLIAVAGTLLGSFSTYFFQQRVAQRAEAAARGERVRQNRLAAVGEFAAAITELKRGTVAVWFRRERGDGHYDALADADRLGAAAEAAKFRMLLVVDHAELRAQADAAFAYMRPLRRASDPEELKAREADFEAHMTTFIATAARLLNPPGALEPLPPT